MTVGKSLFVAWVIVLMVEIYPLIKYVVNSTLHDSVNVVTCEECLCSLPINVWCNACKHASFDCPRYKRCNDCGCIVNQVQ